MSHNIEAIVAELTAKMEAAKRKGEVELAQEFESCARELEAAAQADQAAKRTAHSLLDRSDSVTEALGRRVEGPRGDALVHMLDEVGPAGSRFAAALTRCASLLGGKRGTNDQQ